MTLVFIPTKQKLIQLLVSHTCALFASTKFLEFTLAISFDDRASLKVGFWSGLAKF